MSTRKLRIIIGCLGLLAAIIGFIFILGACGGIEQGGSAKIGARYVFIGCILIGAGLGAVKAAIE